MTALHLLPDAPITSPSFDRLDRMSFVRSFAEAIRAVKGTDSVVLALAGPWGSGKSSLINLISGELEAGEIEQPPLVMRFNPWWFSGSDKLVAAFLQQLAAAVSRPEVKPMLGEATMALDRLSEAIAHPGDHDPAADPVTRDIEVMRKSVQRILRASDRRILIFMDDIDRLTPSEMTQLLLIVRAVADFPNTTYILAFDYEVVVEAIGSKLGVDGRTFLEKVVQLQIDVPIPGRRILERMVIGQLEAIDPHAGSLDRGAQMYFRLLFEGGVKHFLTTPRACTRLLNVLRFIYPTLAGQIYFPDLLGISCLMAFSSQAIQAIRSNSDAFVGHCEASGKGWTGLRAFHTRWLGEIAKRDRAAVEAIVRLMFPKMAWALHGPLPSEEQAVVWERLRRICSVKHFDSYFRLGLTAGEAAEYEWQNMIELLDDATAFGRALQRFGPLEEGEGATWIGELLQKASDFLHEKSTPEQAENMFRAIMRRGDLIAAISDDQDSYLNIEPIHGAVSLLVDCLSRIEQPTHRLKVLTAAVSEDAGLLTAAELLDMLNYRIDIFADEQEPVTVEANTAKLKRVLRILDQRIQQACDSGDLAAHPRYMKIIQKWRLFGRRSRSRRWVRDICASDERFVDALMQLRGRYGLEDDDAYETNDNNGIAVALPVDYLTELFDRDELLSRADRIYYDQPDWLTPEQSLTLEWLSDAL